MFLLKHIFITTCDHSEIPSRCCLICAVLADEPNVIINSFGVAHHSLLSTIDGPDSRDVLGDNVGGGIGVQVKDGDLLASRVGDGVPARIRHAGALDIRRTSTNIQSMAH